MAVHARAFVVALLAAGAVLGIALGAESQKETFLHPSALQEAGLRDAASNLVSLTAVIPATAITAAAIVASRAPLARRPIPAATTWISSYLLIGLLQSAWPNYDAIQEQRIAAFSITPLISNGGDAIGSVYLGPLAILLAMAIVLHASLRRLMASEANREAADYPSTLLRKFVQSYALAVPFLFILIAGNLRLLLSLPNEHAQTTPFLWVFPISILAAVGLIVVGAIKAWYLGAFARNGLLAEAVSEAWQILRRVEWILAGLLAVLALVATSLPAIATPLLEAGRTFGVTTRGHTQAQLLLLVTLVPWMSMDKRVQRATHRFAGHTANLDVAAAPIVIGAWIALGLGGAAAFVATWMLTGPLWAWAFVLSPVVVYGWFKFDALASLWPSFVLAVVLWGIGNTITGSINLSSEDSLVLDVAPGVLALFRILSVIVIGIAIARLARSHARGIRAPIAWPLVMAIAATLSLVVFLELAFTAWILPQEQGEFVGIGSVVASQERAVRTTLHVAGALLAFGAGLATSRIHRPDWFTRRGSPMPAISHAESAA